MSEFVLEAKKRSIGKQSQLTEIRKNSRVPGVVYGFKKESLTIDIEYRDLLKILTEASTSNIIKVKVDGKDIPCIVREYQQDPVTDKLTHVDFLAISDNKQLITKVPLEFQGESKAVREQGAKLDIKAEHVKVKCLPADLPAVIKVDISVLANVGQKLLISDLIVADKVEIMNNPNDPVVSIIIPKKIKLETTVADTEGDTESTEGDTAESTDSQEPTEGDTKKEGEVKEDASKKE